MRFGILGLVLTVSATSVLAVQQPHFNYQARLTDSFGAPLSGVHLIYYSLYDGGDANTANSGASVYAENASSNISGGIVNHTVGTGTATSGKLTAAAFSSNNDMFLQVAVDSPGNVVIPRTQLEPAPFAIAKQPASLFGQFGGSGADGELFAGINGSFGGGPRREFTSFTIAQGATIHTAHKKMFIGVQGTCTIAGTLTSIGEGQPGGTNSNSGSNAFPGGVFVNQPVPGCCSGAGGGGGGGGTNGGGAQGIGANAGNSAVFVSDTAVTLSGGADANSGLTLTDNFSPMLVFPGAGGGAGGSTGGDPKAPGGNGGGNIYIECNELVLTGSVIGDGAVGANGPGTNGVDGGGGGGGGGVVLIRARKITTNTGTVSANGGGGGTGFGGGATGGSGAAGFSDLVEVH